MEPVEITAGRLHLRPWQQADREALGLALADPEVARWTTLAAEGAAGFVAASQQRWAQGSGAEFAVLDSTTGGLLGGVGLHRVLGGDADIGWWTVASARGQGISGEAVQVLSRWAFGALGLHRLRAQVEVGNWASRAVAEKAGFTVEGVLREVPAPGDRRADTWSASLLSGDEVRDRRRLPPYPDRTDGVLTLRRWRRSDALDVQRACADPDIARWLPVPVPYTLEVAQGYVGAIVPHEWAEGTVANCAVTAAADGALLGAVGLRVSGAVGEVGYWVAPWARGRGVAARAARLHAGWGFEALGMARIELLADVDNLASQRAAEKAGWVREGVARAVRAAPREPERRVDMVVFARLAGDR